jgi:hypothetical protein
MLPSIYAVTPTVYISDKLRLQGKCMFVKSEDLTSR